MGKGRTGGPEEPRPRNLGKCETPVTLSHSQIGDALGDTLMRPGRVVVHLVLSQDSAQMVFPEDQHAV
jgi:hypothetical protein